MTSESFSIAVLRFTLAAWVGGAALFVITSVAEQTSPEFGSVIRDQLATIRFPLYYQFGFAALGVSLCSCLVALLTGLQHHRKRLLGILILILLSAAGAAADYRFIYQPLQQLITPPGKARDQQFVILHQRSRHANEVHISLALLAAIGAGLPFSRKPPEPADTAR